MNEITHEQAYEYIHSDQNHLDPAQRDALAIHLNRCMGCQKYARLQERLAPVISHVMHARWDSHFPLNSGQNKITSSVRRNAMLRLAFTFTNASLLLAAIILGLIAALTWALPQVSLPGVAPIGIAPTPLNDLSKRFSTQTVPVETISPTMQAGNPSPTPSPQQTAQKATPTGETVKLPPLQTSIDRYPASNGLIAFVSGQEGNAEIYMMNPDGSNPVNLTKNRAKDTSPVWSPDGKRMAFISNRGGSVNDIYVMNADGSNAIQVTRNPFEDSEIDDRGKKAIPQYSWLSWSPDGQYILAQLWEGSMFGFRLVLARADGGGARYIENIIKGPQWSPDGQLISFVGGAIGTDLVTLDANALLQDGQQIRVGITNTLGWREWQTARWSPDGTHLAVFVMHEITNNFELWVVPSDGKDHKSVSELGSNEWNTGPALPPAWSPDGKKLAFVQNGEIMMVNADGSRLTSLVSVEPYDTLDWSPDGRFLLFTAGNPRQVYLLDVSEALHNPGKTQPVQLTSNPGYHADQADWQPVLSEP